MIIALLVKREDGGPIFYRGVRVGKDGQLFRVFKFRTMVVDAEKIGGPSTADDDPRITKVGKYLRKCKLGWWSSLAVRFFALKAQQLSHAPDMVSKICCHERSSWSAITFRQGLVRPAKMVI